MHLIIGIVIGLFNLVWAGVSFTFGHYEWAFINGFTGIVVIVTSISCIK